MEELRKDDWWYRTDNSSLPVCTTVHCHRHYGFVIYALRVTTNVVTRQELKQLNNVNSSRCSAYVNIIVLLFHTILHYLLVPREYSKFRIESNSYFSIRFNSKWVQLFEIFKYLPSPISYLFGRMTSIFALETVPSNQQNQQTWSCLLAHYGPPCTETPATETTRVWCHKNSWIYLTRWLSRPTITIQFEMKKTLFAQHYYFIVVQK